VKKDTLKYIGLGLIAIVLLAVNVNLIRNMFFIKRDPNIKVGINPSNEQIKLFIDSIYKQINVQIFFDSLEYNRRIITQNEDTIGYAYIVNEPIPCLSCSNINFLLIVENDYDIVNVILLREIYEDFKKISKNDFENFLKNIIGRNLLKSDFSKILLPSIPKKHAKYFLENIKKLQIQSKLLNKYGKTY